MGDHPIFPIRAWRRAVTTAATRIGADAIAPFGFEVTASPRYLSSYLRYLFIYISRSPHLPGHETLIRGVQDVLQETCAEVAATIEIVDCDRFVARTGLAGSRTLVIRSVDAPQSLLHTWARYVVATALTANRSRITAVTDFHSDLMAQRYCCQLATMHDALFSSLPGAPRVPGGERIAEHLRRLQRVGLDERYDVALVDAEFVSDISDAIGRYYAALNRRLDSIGNGGVDHPVPDFHGARILQFRSSALSESLADLAISRYHSYADQAP
jgi:hypothetical protein